MNRVNMMNISEMADNVMMYIMVKRMVPLGLINCYSFSPSFCTKPKCTSALKGAILNRMGYILTLYGVLVWVV
jgi:hypothetical protein